MSLNGILITRGDHIPAMMSVRLNVRTSENRMFNYPSASQVFPTRQRPKSIFFSISMFILANAASVGCVVAGEYALTDGQGIAVCEAYRKNFESRHDVEPMACERHYSPAIPGFSAIPWHRLDLTEHFQLYREAEINLATNVNGGQGTVVPEKDAAEMEKALDSKAISLRVELYVARLPLLGPAHPVNVLSVRELACGPNPKADVKISRLFVLNEAMTHIDLAKQEQFQGWGNNATLVIYKGELYLEAYRPDDNWGTLFTGNGSLSVYRPKGGDFERACSIAFKAK
jgi:hypothetical protein